MLNPFYKKKWKNPKKRDPKKKNLEGGGELKKTFFKKFFQKKFISKFISKIITQEYHFALISYFLM